MSNHLTPQQMLSYIDGELSKSEARKAEDHLHSCWTCLTEVERLKSDIAMILDAQKEQFAPALPPPPKPWASIESLIARSQPEQPVSLRTRLAAYLNTLLTPARLVVVSCVAAALVIFGYSIFRVSTVSAKEVLRRIQVADTERSTITKSQVIRERVHVRKTIHGQNHQQVASVDTWKSRSAAYWNVPESNSAAADLEAQYKVHNIAVDLPLSSASVDSWGRAAGGDATVSRQGADMDVSFAGSGKGAAGSVERVSLLVQPETWQVKQMTLDFADESFEVTEDDYSVIPRSAVPADLLAYLEPPALPKVAGPPAVQPSIGAAASSTHLPVVNLDKAELDVFATLHSLKADLGEPVTVTRSSQAVQLGVWQLPPERQNELRAAFAEQPDVQVQLTAPKGPLRNAVVARAEPPIAGGAPLHIEVESGDEDQRLVKFFGTAEREQDFTNEALGTSTAILSHLYALHNLQGQFPLDKEASLAPEERAQLHMLVQDHATAISTNLDALARQIGPLDANFGVTPCTSSIAPTATNWQSGSQESLETARLVDRILRALLTTSQAPAVPDSALPEIDQNLCRLRAELKSLSMEPH
jgi:anti-sigma factor RsiW